MARRRFVFAGILALALAISTHGFSQSATAKQASFQVKNVFTVRAPKGAKHIRMWMAVPQQDAFTEVDNLKITADTPVRYFADSWGNKIAYAEVQNPPEKMVIQETFGIKRTEVHAVADPAHTRPLNDKERTALQRYMMPSTYVIVNDDIKKLAATIVGNESNPIKAARKIYDWSYQNVNYWVKDPDNMKASPVGSTDYCLRTKNGKLHGFPLAVLFSRDRLGHSQSNGIRIVAKADSEWL